MNQYNASRQVLIDRKVLHTTRPFFQTLLAIVLWANSLGTTVAVALWIEQQMQGSYSWIGAGIGGGVALVLTLAQIYTSDASPGGYVAALLPDVLLTAAPHALWMFYGFRFFVGDIVGGLLAGVLALLLGYWSARLPELLVFGPRKVR